MTNVRLIPVFVERSFRIFDWLSVLRDELVEHFGRHVAVHMQVVNRTDQPESVGNPFRAVPTLFPLDVEREKLGGDHSDPVVALPGCLFVEAFNGS